MNGIAILALFVLLALGSLLAVDLWLLQKLRREILSAREGLLHAVDVGVFGWTPAGRLAQEYNLTIRALQTMFRTVEECQGRFLNQRNKMNTILQSLPGALLSLSDELLIILANKQAEDFFAIEGRQLLGTNLFDLLYLADHDRELLRDAFLYKQSIQNQEICLETTCGMRYFSLNLGFYSDEDSDMAGVLILQDISEQRRLQDSIAMREKLVAMGELAAGVAHELNTPMGNIHGYAQLMTKNPDLPDKIAEYAKIIAEETRRCSRIVQDLLNYAREDRCSGETCEVNQLCQDLVDTFLHCRMKRYNIEISFRLANDNCVVEGGCGQLDIVLTNLIMNSIHALDAVAEPRITIETWLDESHVVIAVSDNGPGVPAAMRSRIFDPFFSTKKVGQGSGLGLSISQAILGKRGGFMVYDNDFADGARFLVKVPAVDVNRART